MSAARAGVLNPSTGVPIVVEARSPLQVEVFRQAAQRHPDRQLATRVMQYLTTGARIQYNGPREPRICQNWPSVAEHMDAVQATINKDVSRGSRAGPYPCPPFATFVGSPMGAFLRKRSHKVRVIHDLSWPPGKAVNQHISEAECAVQYTSVDAYVTALRARGKGTLMAKLDLQDAYKHVMVHPLDWDLLGSTITRDGRTSHYVDTSLPFGLKSAPKIFNEVADMLAYMMTEKGASFVDHYLDDYFTLGQANTPECERNMRIMLDTCHMANVAISTSPGKVVHPTTIMECLGIELDTELMEMRISKERLQEIEEDLLSVSQAKKCKKRRLLSIIGKLVFVSKVVAAGRTFVRRLIVAAAKAHHLCHMVPLTKACKQDIIWWLTYLHNWNGVSMIPDAEWSKDRDLELATDASNIGMGVIFGTHWFATPWLGIWAPAAKEDIAWRELLAVVVTVATYGSQLAGRRLLIHCDNQAIVSAINEGVIRNEAMMKLVRVLFYQCAHMSITIKCVYITTTDNKAADALSRMDMDRFRQVCPEANDNPDDPVDIWTLYNIC